MTKYSHGGLLYNIVYTIWRGSKSIGGYIATWFYKRVVASCGTHTRFGWGIYISFPKNVIIGKNCFIGNRAFITSELSESDIRIGDSVQISQEAMIDFTGGVSIGNGTLISSRAKIYTHDHGYDPRSKPVGTLLDIGENVWIGYYAIVLPGVGKIGDKAIIGAGTVVSKEVHTGEIIVGNPGKVIKYREVE